jgi:hypothetical protein
VDPAGVRELAWFAEPVREAGGDVAVLVHTLDVDTRVGVAVIVVGPHHRGDEAVQVLGDGALRFRRVPLAGFGRLLGRAGRHVREG